MSLVYSSTLHSNIVPISPLYRSNIDKSSDHDMSNNMSSIVRSEVLKVESIHRIINETTSKFNKYIYPIMELTKSDTMERKIKSKVRMRNSNFLEPFVVLVPYNVDMMNIKYGYSRIIIDDVQVMGSNVFKVKAIGNVRRKQIRSKPKRYIVENVIIEHKISQNSDAYKDAFTFG